MKTAMMRGMLSLVICGWGGMTASAAGVPEKAPSADNRGRVCEWKSNDGLAYQFVIPRKYDADHGASLTVILHGSNLDRRWGFANHKPGDFRPADIVVSPDGTTANGQGGFNFLGRPEDAKRFTAFLDELRAALKITAVYLYGHSQGSFFALYYAGEDPEAIAGVVGHASGVWTQTKLSEKGHPQAIVLMHGTADPVVPYGQSAGGAAVYAKKGYPMVRLRSLEGWNHWPAEHNGPIPHVSQQLAWVEGMTSTDTARLGAAYSILAKPKDQTQSDFAALYQLARRVGTLESVPERARDSATKTAEKVEALARQHVAGMDPGTPDENAPPGELPWIGHLPMFLRAFAGVPGADQLRAEWKTVLEAHDDAAGRHLGDYWKALNAGQKKAAFEAGLGALREGYLSIRTADPAFLKNMETWTKDRDLDLDRDEVKEYKSIAKDLEEARKKGRAAFETINKRASL